MCLSYSLCFILLQFSCYSSYFIGRVHSFYIFRTVSLFKCLFELFPSSHSVTVFAMASNDTNRGVASSDVALQSLLAEISMRIEDEDLPFVLPTEVVDDDAFEDAAFLHKYYPTSIDKESLMEFLNCQWVLACSVSFSDCADTTEKALWMLNNYYTAYRSLLFRMAYESNNFLHHFDEVGGFVPLVPYSAEIRENANVADITPEVVLKAEENERYPSVSFERYEFLPGAVS